MNIRGVYRMLDRRKRIESVQSLNIIYNIARLHIYLYWNLYEAIFRVLLRNNKAKVYFVGINVLASVKEAFNFC